MKWRKRGLIYGPDGSSSWAKHSCLTPTPVLIGDVIRVYCGFRDTEGRSRIGYVDVRADDPSKVVAVSREPALDIGAAGCFDDNGVILGDVVADGDRLRMYYVGFQIVARVKFLAFTGLATSTAASIRSITSATRHRWMASASVPPATSACRRRAANTASAVRASMWVMRVTG